MARYACQNCKHLLKKESGSCPNCGLTDSHQRCRACGEIVPQGLPRCPACKARAPLLGKRAFLLRSYLLPV